jgi:putative peptide zinc metalloprotease protein
MMRIPTHGRAILAVAVALALGAGAAVAATESASGDNHVILINEQDGRTLDRAGFSTQHALGDIVDNQNAAVATSAGCTGCRTVATAVQVVLVESNAHTVVPQNIAIALNDNCTFCESMASAYQDVLSTNGIVHFTAEGEQEMSQIDQRISDLTNSSLSFPELESQLDEQVHELWSVVDTELVHAGIGVHGTPTRRVDIERTGGGGECATPMTSASPTVSASPTPSATAPDGFSPSAPSPCPSESPGPSPSVTEATSPGPSSSSTGNTGSSSAPAVSPSPCPSSSTSPSPSPTDTPTSPSPCPSEPANPTQSDSTTTSVIQSSPISTDSPSPTPSVSGT